MRTPSSGHSDPSTQREFKALWKAIDVLSRRFDKQPKIPPPVAGGGPIGATRAEATVTGRSGLTETTGWSFTPLERPGTTPPTLVESTFGHFNVRESGWFQLKAHVGIGWATPPARVNIYLNPATSTAMGDAHQYSQTVALAGGDLIRDIATAPIWLYGDGQDPSMDVGLLGLDAEWDGAGPPEWAEVWIDVIRLS